MERALTKEEKEAIINFGALEYDAERCADILDFDAKKFKKEFDNHKSEIFKLYRQGRSRAEYKIDLKLFE